MMALPNSSSPGISAKAPKLTSPHLLRVYFAQLRDYFELSNIYDEKAKLSVFRMGLSGPEYRQYVMDTQLPATFDLAEAKLLSLFDPDPPAHALCELFMAASQWAEEPVHLYRERLVHAANKAYPTLDDATLETLVFGQLKRGLHGRRLREVARLSSASTSIELVEELNRHEQAYEEAEVRAVGVSTNLEALVTGLAQQVKALQEKVEAVAVASAAPRDQPRFLVTCWNCDRKGHTSRRCRQQRAVCEKCKGGHLAKYCRSDTGDRVSSLSPVCAMSSRAGNLPYVGVFAEISGVTRFSMLDSGASVSLISQTLWTEIGEPPLRPSVTRLSLADRSPLPQMGIVTLPLKLGSIRLLHSFFVVPKLESDCILGHDFLLTEKCSIDYEHQLLHIGGSSVKLQVDRLPGTTALVVSDQVSCIPGMSEAMVQVRIVGNLKAADSWLISAEPTLGYKLGSKLLIASCLVDSDAGPKFLRVMNITQEDICLSAQEPLGKVETVQCTEDKSKSAKFEPIDWDSLLASNDLKPQHKLPLIEVLEEYRDVFASSINEMGYTDTVQHTIDTGGHSPIRVPSRRIPNAYRKDVEDQLEWLLEKGVIRSSTSPWRAPIVMVKKKSGEYRMCIDFRELNSVTQKDSFPLPRIDETLDSLAGATLFTTMDLTSGFYQVPVSPQDIPKTAFATHKGLYEFCRMPMGLCNAPATFQRLMSVVLNGLIGDRCLIYLDDVICFSDTLDEHLHGLRSILQRFREAGLTLNPRKCAFMMRQVSFLGHIVSDEGVKVDPRKISEIKSWPVPTCKAQLKSFMGLASYYRRFVKNFAHVAAPLHALSGRTQFIWSNECNSAFEQLKQVLASTPVLAYPCTDEKAGPFTLDTDASDFAIGGVLSQQIEGVERVIAYASKTLTKAERNYCTTRKELLAVVRFCKEFRPYLLGRQFTIRTDHASLQWLRKLRDPEGQMARWLLFLQDFNFDIVHRPGAAHANADALSRHPRHQGCENSPACQSLIPEPPPVVVGTVSCSELAEGQTLDHDIQVVRVAVEAQRPMSPDEKADLTVWGLALAKNLKDLVIHQGVMKIKRQNSILTVVPLGSVTEVLSELHSGAGGGHFGADKLRAKVETRYWWPDYRNDVVSFVSSCGVCARNKDPPRRPRAELTPVQTSRPNQIIGMDMVGPLPLTARGNRYLLVMVDWFTRWPEVVPVPSQHAKVILPKIFDHWISRHGVPERIHADRGGNFESEEFASFCRENNIRHSRSTAFHPEGNGLTERLNRTLKMLLKTHLIDEANWDLSIPHCLFAIRSSSHETTGFSPFQLMYGRGMTLPSDVADEIDEAEACPASLFLRLKNTLHLWHRQAALSQVEHKSAQKKTYDRSARQQKYNPGDAVWLRNPASEGARKFLKPWRGPYRVIECLSPTNYRLRYWGRQEGPTQVVHHNRLKRCIDVNRGLRDKEIELHAVDPMSASSDSDSEVEFSIRYPALTPLDDAPVAHASSSDSDSTVPMSDNPAPSSRTSSIPTPIAFRLRPRYRRTDSRVLPRPGRDFADQEAAP
jgi:transposase InsO family protein